MVHLTVDIDFFINKYDRIYDVDTASEFLGQLKKDYKPLPYTVVRDHHEVLPFLERMSPSTIINMDYHSDIVTEPYKGGLNEGTWANFYSKRKKASFIWRYPGLGCVDDFTGLCDYWKPDKMGYMEVKKSKFRMVIPKGLTSYSVCLSPQWVEEADLKELRKRLSWLRIRKRQYSQISL
jgi:hypothetical protein